MRKFLAVILAIIMVFSLCACGDKEKAEKYCFNCGEGISKDVAFCEHCGTKVGDAKTESEVDSTNTESTTNTPTETTKPTDTNEPTTTSKPTTTTTSKPTTTTTSKPTTTTTSKPTTTTSKPSTTKHTHSYSKKVTAATCTAKGYTTYTCSCGHSYKDNYTNPSCKYEDYKCTVCGSVAKAYAYEYLMEWVKEHGKANGGYTRFTYTSGSNTFMFNYSAQADTLSVALANVSNGGNAYTSLYLDDFFYGCTLTASNGEKAELVGYLNAGTFTSNSAISYSKYTGAEDIKHSMIEATRLGLCEIVDWMEWCFDAYDIGITIRDLCFAKY